MFGIILMRSTFLERSRPFPTFLSPMAENFLKIPLKGIDKTGGYWYSIMARVPYIGPCYAVKREIASERAVTSVEYVRESGG